jgi:hypothetical protein
MVPYGVGDMVVCIYDGEWSADIQDPPEVTVPIKGCVYTVRTMHGAQGAIYVRLVEIVNALFNCYEPAFLADLFRPVKKTSIESLEKICLTTPIKRVLEVIE